MKSISAAPEIIAMANGLNLAHGDPVQQILAHCRDKIQRWLRKHGRIHSILDLERIVCDELNLTIREIWSDDDLEGLINEFVEEGDHAFALLRADLDEETFATLMCCRQLNPRAPASYVAVIDCRGAKQHRRFFSRWHEIAHLLTLYTQLEFPFHRSTIEKTPTEQMMDMIAGEVGFLAELFAPHLDSELKDAGRLTFQGVDRVRSAFCSDASFLATLHACVGKASSPMVLLELGLGYKRCELQAIQASTGRLPNRNPPKPKLRVLNAMPNSAARQAYLQVHKNMRVPEASILFDLFHDAAEPDFESLQAEERLGIWTTSDGDALADMAVHVEGIRVQERVLALVTPSGLSGPSTDR